LFFYLYPVGKVFGEADARAQHVLEVANNMIVHMGNVNVFIGTVFALRAFEFEDLMIKSFPKEGSLGSFVKLRNPKNWQS
jgi:hypothetical protein